MKYFNVSSNLGYVSFIFDVQVIQKFVKARTLLNTKVLHASEFNNTSNITEELKEIKKKIQEYENKARAKCANIETETGNNEVLVKNFDQFLSTWDEHIKQQQEKKRAKAAGISIEAGRKSPNVSRTQPRDQGVQPGEQSIDLNDGFNPPKEQMYAKGGGANETLGLGDESILTGYKPQNPNNQGKAPQIDMSGDANDTIGGILGTMNT